MRELKCFSSSHEYHFCKENSEIDDEEEDTHRQEKDLIAVSLLLLLLIASYLA